MANDIIFISYDEPNAQKHWAILKDQYPTAKRVHGVDGIREAHIAAANKSMTNNFFVVDGDTEILPESEEVFAYDPPEWDKQYVHIWESKNPVNGLVYGYGGIKLLHKSMLSDIDMLAKYVDFTTTLGNGLKVMKLPNPPSITHFNSDSFHAWKGAFRECAKLAALAYNGENNAGTEEARYRLTTWITQLNAKAPFAYSAKQGALFGAKYGSAGYHDKVMAMSKINDDAVLKALYREHNK